MVNEHEMLNLVWRLNTKKNLSYNSRICLERAWLDQPLKPALSYANVKGSEHSSTQVRRFDI